MKSLISILKNKKGEFIPLVIPVVIVLIMLMVVISQYIRLNIIAQGVRDAVQSAVISVSTGNYDGVYASLREGYSGGYVNDGSGWVEQVSTGDVYARLSELLGLQNEGGHYVKYADSGVMEYRVSDLTVEVINAPLAPADRDEAQKFRSEATIYLEVPLSFARSILPPMRITLKCMAGWSPKF